MSDERWNRLDDSEPPKSLDDVRARHKAFEHWYKQGGGYRSQEVADVGFLLGIIEQLTAQFEKFRYPPEHRISQLEAELADLTASRDRHERDVDTWRQRYIEKCAEVERLLVALNAEWAYAHSEACTNVGDCESFGKERICSYPRPSVLSRSAV